MDRLTAEPTASIPKACQGWGETIGAYRFFANQRVEWCEIMSPHWQRSQERMSERSVVLCLQDTTELNFNGQSAFGLGPLSYESQRGMYLHPTYAVTPEREPLGIIDAWMWARQEKDEFGVRGGLKESLRWIEGYERVAEMAANLPHTRLVYVADREADMLALMLRAQELGQPADWLIRAKHNRCLPDGEKLWQHIVDAEPIGEITFAMAAREGGVKARTVKQQLWARRVELPAGKGKVVHVTCIIAREINAPKAVKPIEWRLLTNRSADTPQALVELIDWYRARWEIEMFFNVLKNACKVEALQLGSVAQLERALALFMVVSWRISHLMRLGRTSPDLEASLFFDPDEIQAAYLLRNKVPPAKPRLNEVLRQIACVGGFLARKGDGEPGAKTIWLGLKDVYVAAQTIRALRHSTAHQNCV